MLYERVYERAEVKVFLNMEVSATIDIAVGAQGLLHVQRSNFWWHELQQSTTERLDVYKGLSLVRILVTRLSLFDDVLLCTFSPA